MTDDFLKKRSNHLLVIVLPLLIAGMFVTGFSSYCLWKRFRRRGKINFIEMVKYSIV